MINATVRYDFKPSSDVNRMESMLVRGCRRTCAISREKFRIQKYDFIREKMSREFLVAYKYGREPAEEQGK